MVAAGIRGCALCPLLASTSRAQDGGGGGGNTIGTGNTSGVAVDAEGVLRQTTVNDPTGALARQRVQEALSRLDRNVARTSKLRKVSLNRLEQANSPSGSPQANGADDVMKNLAGLTRVQYVFCYPESGDIVIAGPAEAWGEAPSGRMLGVDPAGRWSSWKTWSSRCGHSRRATSKRRRSSIARSIRPRKACRGCISSCTRSAARSTGPPQPGSSSSSSNGLRDELGMQVITVGGVPANTHFAQVMVEADYRMKLIGIGLEQPPVRLTSYVERANPHQVASNALQRWYFVPDYQCVQGQRRCTGDGTGRRRREAGRRSGSRQQGRPAAAPSKRANPASQAFVNAFTKVYPKLAERSPVYAQLRNCIDLAVAAAYIREQDFYSLAKWKPERLRATSRRTRSKRSIRRSKWPPRSTACGRAPC